MEFEKLKDIIAEVIECTTRMKLQWILHLWMILERIRWIFSRLLWESKKNLISRLQNEDAEKIATVGDAVEQIKNACKLRGKWLQGTSPIFAECPFS